jgi:ADP-ribosyl-[dinitrogen reductase] hydrolase
MLNKIKGSLFGFAIGDALGGTTEFLSREEIIHSYGKVTDIIGGGCFDLTPGETTDDTAMTIAVINGILANSKNPIPEIGKEFIRWYETDPKDVGITIRTVLDSYIDDWYKAAKYSHGNLGGKSAGNGSLMRCLPIALAYSDKMKIEELSILQSKMTHYDDLAAEACVIYNKIANRLLLGENLKTSIYLETKGTRYESDLAYMPTCKPDGYVVHTFTWVLYWLLNSNTFEDVVVGATNMGEDSDTVAAIAGGLKGLEVGFDKLPVKFTSKLLDRELLLQLSNFLYVIRDQDTNLLKNSGADYLQELKEDTNKLLIIVEEQQSYKSKIQLMNKIIKNIYLYRFTFTEEVVNFDRKLFVWRQVENRYNRALRLFDLGAPTIIQKNEVTWLQTMIEHMEMLFRGIEPTFTQEQLDELRMTEETEAELEEYQ